MPKYQEVSERAALQAQPLTDRQKELMLTVLLRDETSFMTARTQLKPQHFRHEDRRFAMAWNAACDYYDQYQELPGEEEMLAEIEQRVQLVQDELMAEEIESLDESLRRIYLTPQAAIKPRYGVEMCKRFILDSLADNLAHASNEWQGSRPIDLGRLLSQHQEQVQEVESLGAVEEASFPADWKPKPLHKVTAGLPFWDHFMNGGQAGGEVYGLLGPFGSCKTTLLTQTAVAQARWLNGQWVQAGRVGLPKQVYLATYEENKDEIRARMIGCAAQILRDRLEELEDWRLLESENLQEYERNFFANAIRQGINPLPERRRVELALRWLGRTVVILDMTQPGTGIGLADELAAKIRADQQSKANPGVHSVFIDYAGAAVERFLDHHNMDRKEMRHRLKTFPLHCKQKIAVPYKSSVWVAHQLSGQANAKSSGSAQQHTDAAETKSFAENLVFCFTVGVKDQTTSNCVLAKTKARRAGGSPHRVIRVAGEMYRTEDVDHLYTVDPATSRIVSRSDLNRVHEAREPSTVVPGARTHNVSQFSQAAVAGLIPTSEDDLPRRRLARRER